MSRRRRRRQRRVAQVCDTRARMTEYLRPLPFLLPYKNLSQFPHCVPSFIYSTFKERRNKGANTMRQNLKKNN